MTASHDPTDRNVGGLSLRGIGKKYGPITVLNDVNLDVRPGEAIALLGENGAGKSTLASIIAGLVQPTIGSMTWRGQDYAPDAPGRRAVGRNRPHSSGDAAPAGPVDRRECVCRAPPDAGRPY